MKGMGGAPKSDSIDLSRRIKAGAAAKDFTAEEGFLWSRIGGGLRLDELLPLCPWSQEETLQKLEALVQKKGAEWVDADSSDKNESSGSDWDSQLDGDDPRIDLDREFRKDILNRFQKIENLKKNAFEILEVDLHSNLNEIKNQYLTLSRKYHPDRFFKKHLGSYKEKLELIFARIQKAYALLKNPIDRDALNKTLALQQNQSKKNSEPSTELKKKVYREKKLDPEMQKMGKAEHHYKKALELEKTGDFIGAYENLSAAVQLNASRQQYQKALEGIKPQMLQQQAKANLQSAERIYQNQGATEQVFQLVDDALSFHQNLAEGQLLLGKIILEMQKKEKYRDAKEILLRANAALPKDPEPSFLLARVFHLLDDEKSSRKFIDEALKRNSHHLPSQKFFEKHFKDKSKT